MLEATVHISIHRWKMKHCNECKYCKGPPEKRDKALGVALDRWYRIKKESECR